MPNNKYNQLKRQYSLDGGITWHDLLPMVYKVGNVIETNSNCTDSDGCRWVILPITEAYDCDSNYNMYQVEAEECLNENGVFVRSGNIRRYQLIEDYSIACGYSGPICTPTSITSYSYDIVYNGGAVEWDEVATPVVYKITTISEIDKGCNETTTSNREEITDYSITYSPSGDNTNEEDRTVTATVIYKNENIGSFSYTQKGKICEPSTSITYTNYVITYNGGDVEWNEVATPVVTATENTTVTNSNCDETTTTTTSTEIVDYSITYSPSGDNATVEDRTVTAIVIHKNNNVGDFTYTQKSLNMAEPTQIGNIIFKGKTYFSSAPDYQLKCKSGFGDNDMVDYTITDNGNNEYIYEAEDFNNISCEIIAEVNLGYVKPHVYEIVSFPDTSKMISFKSLFYDFIMESANLINFNTSNVTDMSYMFDYCEMLTTLNLSGWDVSNVTNISYMFRSCRNLAYLDLSGWELSSNITKYEKVFENCSSLQTIVMNGSSCKSVSILKTILLLNNISLDKVNIITDATDCIEDTQCSENTNCGNIISFTLRRPVEPKVIYLNETRYYNAIPSYPELERLNTVYSVDISTIEGALPLTSCFDFLSTLSSDSNIIKNILCFPDVSNVVDMSSAFSNGDSSYLGDANANIECINVKGWNTSNVTNMEAMFGHQTKLKDIIGIEDWDVSNVTNMNGMFWDCHSLTSLDLSKWNVSKLQTQKIFDYLGMFYGCSGLTTLNLSGWDVSNVNDMAYMFYDCHNLVTLNLSEWDLSYATNLDFIFAGCNNLTTIYAYGCNETTINKLNSIKPTNCTLVY